MSAASTAAPAVSSDERSSQHASSSGMSRLKMGWTYLKRTFNEWSSDKATKLSASLAFYTMLSLAPLLIVAIRIVGWLFGEKAAQGQVKTYLQQTMGGQNAETIQGMIKSANTDPSGTFATIFSICLLVVSASGVFGELQDSLNTVWEVKPRPNRGLVGTIKDRFFSMALVLGIAFLLLVSLVLSTVLSGMVNLLGAGHLTWLWEAVHFIVSIGVITVLFGLMYKYLPDVKLAWKDVWIGAIVTAVLFTVGKFILGWYLGRDSATSVYGAAGSLVAMLLWVYYSAMILFFGAEFTQVYAKAHNRGIQPDRGAMPMTEESRAQRGLSPKRGAKPGVFPAPPRPSWQQYDPSRRVVTIDRTGPAARKSALIGAGGIAAGVAVAAAGWFKHRSDLTPAVSQRLRDRLDEIDRRLGSAKDLQRYGRELDLHDRMKAIEHRIDQATRATHKAARAAAHGQYVRPERVAGDGTWHKGEIVDRFVQSFRRGRREAAEPQTPFARVRQWLHV